MVFFWEEGEEEGEWSLDVGGVGLGEGLLGVGRWVEVGGGVGDEGCALGEW